jgi:hypothetical protein
MKKILALLLCGVMLLSLAACVEDDTPQKEVSGQSGESTTQQTPENTKDTFGLNETAVFSDLKFTATEISESTGTDFFTPEDGNVFVGIKFTIENISSEDQSISSILLFDGYVDDVKCSYSLNASIVFDEGSLDGELAPGKKLVGWYSLEVPKDWKTIELDVQSSWLSSSSATFVFEK